MSSYNTNLAAEYYVLSVLYRLGLNAYLTVGNKKAVDIIIGEKSGELVTIDVKGLAGKTGWPVDNVKRAKQRHFIVFVCFRGEIDRPESVPEAFIIPSRELRKYIYKAPGGRRVVSLATLMKKGLKYRFNWKSLSKI